MNSKTKWNFSWSFAQSRFNLETEVPFSLGIDTLVAEILIWLCRLIDKRGLANKWPGPQFQTLNTSSPRRSLWLKHHFLLLFEHWAAKTLGVCGSEDDEQSFGDGEGDLHMDTHGLPTMDQDCSCRGFTSYNRYYSGSGGGEIMGNKLRGRYFDECGCFPFSFFFLQDKMQPLQ